MTNQQWQPGQWLEVKSKEEILATLDQNGRLGELPFMPEMLQFCGKRFKVFKSAHKTCDPPNGMGSRSMQDAVHLEGVRCDGGSHGGCQARCLIFWKRAWLKEAGSAFPGPPAASGVRISPLRGDPVHSRSTANDQPIWSGAYAPESGAAGEDSVYVCQSTQLRTATKAIRWWEISQYVKDYASGNVTLGHLLGTFFIFLYRRLETSRLGFGSFLRWAYDGVQTWRGRAVYPWREGLIPVGLKTPRASLDLRPGELVRVKSYAEIVGTLDENSNNRGMYFDAEMVPYCGGTYRVLDRVNRIVNEKTGKLQILKNDCIILEDVVCKACYVKTQKFCSRSIYPFWREIWLERAAEKAGSQGKPPGEGAVSSRRSTIAEDSPTSRPAVAIGHTKRISVASGCRDMTANG